jgi:hypothetical protein
LTRYTKETKNLEKVARNFKEYQKKLRITFFCIFKGITEKKSLKKIVFLIFLFVAAGKFHQAVEFCTPLGSTSASQVSKKSDKSLVFKDNTSISKSRLGKGKKRKPKGIEIKSLGISIADFEFHVISNSLHAFNYCSPELINTSLFVLGRAPPLA